MIWDIITGFLPDIWGYVAAAGAAIVAIGAAYLKGRSGGAARVERKQAEAGLKAATEGREAARTGKAEAVEALRDGKTPEEIVRGNDNAWR